MSIYSFCAILSILLVSVCNVNSSRITFQNGRYNDILVAIHPNTKANLCNSIIPNLTDAFKEAGSVLYNATDGEATFGAINILLPSHWTADQCSRTSLDIISSEDFQTYQAADFKITSTHPIAKSLPWTKQYRGCGKESETVYLPLYFLINSTFTLDTKGKLLVHEWTKFRYGVFEESGFFDDPIFSPCFTMGGKQYFTSCTGTDLDDLGEIGGQIEPEKCRSLISNNVDVLMKQLRQGNSSMLFAPHFNNVRRFCTNETHHNILAPTRQNVFCERKSVSEVIFSHEDFNTQSDDRIFPNNRIPRPGSSPKINLIQRTERKNAGFVFIIEDTPNMREFGKVEHVKQGIAEMFRLASDKTEVALYRYNGVVNWPITRESKARLKNAAMKAIFLKKIPGNSTFFPILFGPERYGRRNHPDETPLDKTFKDVLEELGETVRWNMILVTSLPPVNLPEALDLISKSEHSLSVLTFDSSTDWLKFNSIPNTRKLVFLPICFQENNTCQRKTSSLIADHLIELVATAEEPRRYFHKVIDVDMNESVGIFKVNNVVQDGWNFVLHFPTINDMTKLTLLPPFSGGVACMTSKMLDYDGVLEAGSGECPYKAGMWTYTIQEHPPNVPVDYNLRGYVETFNTQHDLIVSYETNQNMDVEVFPSKNQMSVYLSVTNKDEQPVVGATVELQVYYEQISFDESDNTIILYDNGIDPDLTADDGVYSTFLTTFNSNPSYHTMQARVRTKPLQSKAIASLRSDTFEAALMDSKMSSKCCGSKLAYEDTVDIGYSYYTVTLPSFRTGERLDRNQDFIPPAKIYTPITLVQDTREFLEYEFLAPGSDNNIGKVNHYSICCTSSTRSALDASACHVIDDDTCTPTEPNSKQLCRIDRPTLLAKVLNETIPLNGSILFCGFRGVDAAGNNGRISSFLIDIPMTADGRTSKAKTECASISDGCLPVKVLWGLILCIAGLILILFIVLICWIWTTKKNKKEKSTAKKSSLFITRSNRRSSFPEAMRNVFTNQAYIDESIDNSQLRHVVSDAQLSKPPTRMTDAGFNDRSAAGIRRRSISASEISPPFNPTGTSNYISKNDSWNATVDDGDQEKYVPMFFLPQNVGVVTARPSSGTPRPFRNSSQNQNETHPSLINSTFVGNRISNTSTNPKMEPKTGQIYASVQRFGRKTLKTEPFKSPLPIPMNQTWDARRGQGQLSSGYASSSASSSKSDNPSNNIPSLNASQDGGKTVQEFDNDSIMFPLPPPPPPPHPPRQKMSKQPNSVDEDDGSDNWDEFEIPNPGT